MSTGVRLVDTAAAEGWGVQEAVQNVFYGLCEGLEILFTDILPANVTSVIPNAFSWAYRSLWTGSITCYTLQSAVGKTAHLFTHAVPRDCGRVPAVLLLHGDHSHPLTMLHLADIAETRGCAVFSVHLPYDDYYPGDHCFLLQKSIDKVREILGNNVSVVLAGHSRGALEAAHEAYVERNQKVSGVIAIAGRFQIIEPSMRPCRDSLKPTVDAVWQKLRLYQHLRAPFYQIAASHDWCIDPEASIVRLDHHNRSVEAGHLGVLNHPDTLRQFGAWVAER